MSDNGNKLMEQLADIQHEIWSSWMRYVFNECCYESGGDMVIPSRFVKHWKRQIKTDYKDLDEIEKETDRDQVRKFQHLIK